MIIAAVIAVLLALVALGAVNRSHREADSMEADLKRMRGELDEFSEHYRKTPCTCPPTIYTGHLEGCPHYELEQALIAGPYALDEFRRRWRK